MQSANWSAAPLRFSILLGLALVSAILIGDSVDAKSPAESTAIDRHIGATVIREERLADLPQVVLPDGSTFQPYLRRISVRLDEKDVNRVRDAEKAEVRAGIVASGKALTSPEARRALEKVDAKFDTSLALSGSENCSLYVVQRLPDVAIGQASHSTPCVQSDPVDTHFWGNTGQVYYGLDVAGWGSDYCGPTTPPRQYLWLQDASGAYGFYQNYSGRAKGSCTGTRNHVRLWSLYSGIAGGQLFSVGTAHREVWDWLDFNHHVVPNGWHIARDAMLSDHPAPGGYYYWGNWGYYGSGGYFGGSVAELGCYSPYPCY